MTTCSEIPKECKKSKRSGALKLPRRYIDPDDFHLMRRRAFLNTQQAAELLDVTHRHYRTGKKGVHVSPTPLIEF